MAMNLGPGDGLGPNSDPEPILEINTTPLIDVMLVLLVMLIITIPIQLHSTDLNLPTGKPPVNAVPPEVVKIDIDPANVVYWQGVALPDRAALEDKLKAAAAQDVPPEIHIRPDAKSRYDTFAAVMVSAQKLGLRKLGVVGGEQFQ
ncbi:biopolymer transporter ExbD [uncultured Sphaerotilus sp.]|uniref:ExbD/TolR family protein n=1 Tax=uncultured Sphaerotilus sp. TaxID=474984 RepID=UPI0030CA58E7